MAQDKSAEIIKFNGPGEAPAVDIAPEAEASAQSLEEAGAGAYLAQARHRAKLTIEQASEATKVKAEHLEAIEWMRLDRLPSLPYATGFVKAYARYLKLDAEAVAAQFKLQANALTASVAPALAPKDSSPDSGEGAKLGSVFAMLAVALFALWIGYQVLTGGGRDADVNQANAIVAPAPVAATNMQIVDVTPAADPEFVAPPAAEENDTAANEALETLPTSEVSPESVETASADNVETAAAIEPVVDAASIEAPRDAEAPALTAPSPAETERRERPLPRRAAPEPVRAPVIVEAVLTRSTTPDYPNSCTRRADAIESVTIVFDVSAAGRAVNSRVASSTNNCFDAGAMRTVARWRFDPRTIDGNAVVESGKRATLNFKK
jgi:cytoskeleton protein RodZ